MHNDNLIFIHRIIKAIADAIIIVFIPLYILKQTDDIALSMGYLVIYSLFVLAFMLVLKKVIQRFGIICIMLHFIPIIATEAILSFAQVNIYTVLACAALMAMSQTLYSIPLNVVFAFGDKKTNVGKFQIAQNIGKLLFTLASALILSNVDNSFMFLALASALFYIGSMVPLIFAYKTLRESYVINKGREGHKHIKIDFWFILFHITFGIFQPVMDNVVPLYLYINNLSFQAVALFIVLVELLKLICNYISQFAVKKNKSLILVIISFCLFMISITGIIFVKNSVALYVLSCTASVSFPLTFVPMFGRYCNYLKETNNVFEGITRRDIDIFSLRAPMYALCYIGFGLVPCLIVGVCAVPVMLLTEIKILKKKEDKNIE